jgi:signal transduction histidine kinase
MPITHALVVIQNITQRKTAEQTMLQALNQQKDLNELKSRFVTLASHEFRTPLSTILSSADLAMRFGDKEDKENFTKHLNRIKSSVKGLNEILNDFLSLSSIEEGVIRNNPIQFNVKEFCTELTEESETIKKADQLIHYEHQGDKELILLDRWHLKNILTNLISNAIKYSPPGTTINLTSEVNSTSVRFIVEDHGIGIPDEDKPHLFKTFFRAQNAAHIQGTGIGMHIVKRYLEIMGGSIHFESKLNKGSTFVIDFPSVATQ